MILAWTRMLPMIQNWIQWLQHQQQHQQQGNNIPFTSIKEDQDVLFHFAFLIRRPSTNKLLLLFHSIKGKLRTVFFILRSSFCRSHVLLTNDFHFAFDWNLKSLQRLFFLQLSSHSSYSSRWRNSMSLFAASVVVDERVIPFLCPWFFPFIMPS